MKILLGKQYVENDRFPMEMVNYLSVKGVNIDLISKFNQRGVRIYLEENREVDVLILQEYIEQKLPVPISFLNKILEQNPRLMLVYIVSDGRKKETSYLIELYKSKIYNVVFEQDATVQYICDLILEPRLPIMAKAYFNLTDEKLELVQQEKNIDISPVLNYLNLHKSDEDLIERYEYIVARHSETENKYIVSQLPMEIIEKLVGNVNFDRFYQKPITKTEKRPFIQLSIPGFQKGKESSQNNLSNQSERIITKEKIVTKEIVKHIYDIPNDYKKILAFFSTESTGKSEIAANVAYSISKQDKKVALLDLDLIHYGQRYIYKVAGNPEEILYGELFNDQNLDSKEEIEDENVLDFALKVNANLYVFSGHPAITVEISVGKLNTVLKMIKSQVDIVVLDIGKNIDQELLQYILGLDNLEKYMVVTQHLATISRIPLKYNFSNSDTKNWRVIINQFENEVKIDELEIEDILPYKINDSFRVPNVYSDILQNIKGGELAYEYSSEEYRKSIDSITSSWLSKKEESNNLISKLLSKFKKEEEK